MPQATCSQRQQVPQVLLLLCHCRQRLHTPRSTTCLVSKTLGLSHTRPQAGELQLPACYRTPTHSCLGSLLVLRAAGLAQACTVLGARRLPGKPWQSRKVSWTLLLQLGGLLGLRNPMTTAWQWSRSRVMLAACQSRLACWRARAARLKSSQAATSCPAALPCPVSPAVCRLAARHSSWRSRRAGLGRLLHTGAGAQERSLACRPLLLQQEQLAAVLLGLSAMCCRLHSHCRSNCTSRWTCCCPPRACRRTLK